MKARLEAIEERTGAKIGVRVVEDEKRMGNGRDAGKSGKAMDAIGLGGPTNQQPAQPSAKLPWTMNQPTSPPVVSPTAQQGLPISDSGRSKSMYPFLPVHQMPQVAEQQHQGEEIQRTDSPECIASPESITAPLPSDVPQSANMVHIPSANADADPWSARSKTIDVPRPRVAGLKSPLPSAPVSAAPSVPVDEEAVLEELKAWGFAEEKVCEVEIRGREECVRAAGGLVLVLMDELVSWLRIAGDVFLILE